jgi:hypothetical protein
VIGRLVGRGALAGLIAGLVEAAYGLAFVEPSLQRAIDLESARPKSVGEAPTELVSRAGQHVGLVVGLAVVGLTLGLLYGVALALVHRSRGALESWAPGDVWRESVRLAAGGFAGMFVRYPANPPGIGGPDTINTRTVAWLLAVLLGLFAAALAWRIAALLVERGVAQPLPALAVTVILAAALGVLFLALPARPDPSGFPAGLLWTFRIASFGSYVVLWGGLACAFTLLTRRAGRSAR